MFMDKVDDESLPIMREGLLDIQASVEGVHLMIVDTVNFRQNAKSSILKISVKFWIVINLVLKDTPNLASSKQDKNS